MAEAEETIRTPVVLERQPGEVRNVIGLRAKAFLGQEYPLTEEGQKLRVLTQQALDRGERQELEAVVSQLPTVENPRLNLFKDFDLTPEQEASIFGTDLANVQTTKGCSHKCDFCAAGAEAGIQKMPFAAVLKIAEKKKEFDLKIDEVWRDWEKVRNEIIGEGLDPSTINGRETATDFAFDRTPEDWDRVSRAALSTFVHHPISSIGGNRNPLIYELFDKDLALRQNGSITNYYDSDPFDYQDSTFPHEDGTPADYGDVFAAMATNTRKIHITTAGWPRGRKAAQRAAEKIAELVGNNPDLISNPRVSINKFEYRARNNAEVYRADMENTLVTLGDLGGRLEVLLFGDKKDPEDIDFITTVIDPIRNYLGKHLPKTFAWSPAEVSYFSGPMADPNREGDHHDIMACMPGIHIWPDGSIAYQRYEWGTGKIYTYFGFEDRIWKNITPGTRPMPTGPKLFEKIPTTSLSPK